MYQLLDIGFIVFHTLIILFNLFGWIWEATRKWNLGLLLLTGSSWFILGIWYGWGYCPCTHWHWIVRQKLGYTDLPDSYIAFLIEQITGLSLPANLVDVATVSLFFLALLVSIFVNYRDFDKKPIAV